MSELNELIRRNLEATKRRGQITDKTTIMHFIKKIHEEHEELIESYINSSNLNPSFDPIEAVDVAITALTMLEHHGYDSAEIMKKKVEFNEKRSD